LLKTIFYSHTLTCSPTLINSFYPISLSLSFTNIDYFLTSPLFSLLSHFSLSHAIVCSWWFNDCGPTVCGYNLVGEAMRHNGEVGLIWWVSVLVSFGCFLSVMLVLSQWCLRGLGLFWWVSVGLEHKNQ